LANFDDVLDAVDVVFAELADVHQADDVLLHFHSRTVGGEIAAPPFLQSVV
jgi:hypothetical protein